ncbi:hypothetical protein LPJ66_004008 [Kickxella alabastrina]|uniref:Uncharacterized protein n=1 Tax=Kickxella alabastrina TaxID=61397 RepID=A0ACC1IJ57_9FUNG|nr:hypothetical protein LPJ66_004008 [Kickxella alabastrina]
MVASSENKGFSLFSAINGLFERARSSAEKESQRLFTTPPPSKSRQEPQFNSERVRRTTHNSPSSLSRRSVRTMPPLPLPSVSTSASNSFSFSHTLGGRPRTATPRGRRAPSPALHHPLLMERASSVVSEGTHLANNVNLMAIQEEDFVQLDGTDHFTGNADSGFGTEPALSIRSKRKWIEHEESSLEQSLFDEATKKPRTGTEEIPDINPHQYSSNTAAELRIVMPPPPAPPLPAAAAAPLLQKTSTPVVQFSKIPPRPKHSNLSVGVAHSARRSQARSNSVGHSSMPMPVAAPTPMQPPSEIPSFVERSRLEKVERELHRLKKIIASLIPEELDDDDLRSVYGDLEQPRFSPENIVAQLMKTRLGAHINAYAERSSVASQNAAMHLPPSPTSMSPVRGGDQNRNRNQQSRRAQGLPMAPPLSPPPPQSPEYLPMSPLLTADSSFSLHNRREHSNGQSRGDGERPHSRGSMRRREPQESTVYIMAENPRMQASTVRRLRQELRPVSKRSIPPPQQQSLPHKDPGVMSKLLAEMKHHRLRPVKKPKDMVCASDTPD